MHTLEIVKLIQDKLERQGFDATVSIQCPGGDYDTDGIVIEEKSWGNDGISVLGFSDDSPLTNTSDWSKGNIGLIEMQSMSSDSSGGMQGNSPSMWTAFGHVRQLFQEMDFQVVNSMKDYF